MKCDQLRQCACRLFGLSLGARDWAQRWLTPLLDLGFRLYVANAFLRSGWLKLSDWDNTLELFRYVYQVPLMPPLLAAIAGTAGEVGFSLLLIAGLATRLGALGLFGVNVMAVLSFPDLSELGLQDHVLWGTMLAVTVLHGPGKLSLDHWLTHRCKPHGAA